MLAYSTIASYPGRSTVKIGIRDDSINKLSGAQNLAPPCQKGCYCTTLLVETHSQTFSVGCTTSYEPLWPIHMQSLSSCFHDTDQHLVLINIPFHPPFECPSSASLWLPSNWPSSWGLQIYDCPIILYQFRDHSGKECKLNCWFLALCAVPANH